MLFRHVVRLMIITNLLSGTIIAAAQTLPCDTNANALVCSVNGVVRPCSNLGNSSVSVFRYAGETFAADAQTRIVFARGTDSGSVFDKAIRYANSHGGGVVSVSAGTYAFSTVPSFPVGMTHWVQVVGSGVNTVLSLSPTAPTAFQCDFDGSGTNSCQRVWLENFVVNANSVDGRAGVIFSPKYYKGDGCQHRNQSFKELVVRTVRADNVPYDYNCGPSERYGITIFSCVDPASGVPTYRSSLSDLYFENITVNGGNAGLAVFGDVYPRGTPLNPSALIDRVTVKGLVHTLPLVPVPSPAVCVPPSALLQIGSYLDVGSVQVSASQATGEFDEGVEINNFSCAYVGNTTVTDVAGPGFFFTNFSDSYDKVGQRLYLDNDIVYTTTARLAQRVAAGFDFQGSSESSGTATRPLGSVTMTNSAAYLDDSRDLALGEYTQWGVFARTDGNVGPVTIDTFTGRSAFVHDSSSANQSVIGMELFREGGAVDTATTVKNVTLTISTTLQQKSGVPPGSGTSVYGLALGGGGDHVHNVTIENVSVASEETAGPGTTWSGAANRLIGVLIGGGASRTQLSGHLWNVSVGESSLVNRDDTPSALWLYHHTSDDVQIAAAGFEIKDFNACDAISAPPYALTQSCNMVLAEHDDFYGTTFTTPNCPAFYFSTNNTCIP